MSEKRDTIPKPKVTILANLPDSLQPKVTYLDQVPAPITKIFSIPPPSKIFIDSVTGLPIPPYMQGSGFFTNYTTEDGLCFDMVHCAFRDKKDQLWFGTMGGGVSRYDGKTFTSFTTEHGLPSNTVWCIDDDKFGNLWFATNNGLSRYDGRTFVNFTTAQGLPGNDFGRILEDESGNLWFAVLGHGLLKYDGKSFTNYTTENGLSSNDVWCMSKDHEGKFWCGTRGGGIFYFDPQSGNTQTFSVLSGVQQWGDISFISIFEDKDCKMWFGTDVSGALCYDGESFTNYTTRDGLGCNTILSFKEDKQGILWVGTCEGLSRFDNQSFFTYGAQQGLTNKMVNCIIDDKSGNIWFGTYGGGVFLYEGDSFVSFKSGPINNNVSSILEDKTGHLWFGTRYRGISLYDGKKITTFMPVDGLATNWINYMMQDTKGNIWFSTNYGGGAERLSVNLPNEFLKAPILISSHSDHQQENKVESLVNLTTFTTSQGLIFDAVLGITEDRNGNLWFATYGGGISKFDGKSFTTFTTAQGLMHNEVLDIIEDSRSDLWFQYVGPNGITVFDGKSFLNLTTSEGLADNSINSFSEDLDGNLWFGTQKGMCLLRKEKAIEIFNDNRDPEFFKSPIFETFTIQEGLPTNIIYDIVPDEEGNLLLATNVGLVFLKGGLIAFSHSGNIEIFNSEQGYPLRSTGGIFKDSKGIIWITTDSDKTGLVRFDPNALHKNWDPPEVILQSIKIDNESINWYNLLPNSTLSELPDSNSTPAFITEEVKLYGRQLSKEVRDSLRLNFMDIRFDTITSWYSVPLNLVLPYNHNNITFDFHANITTRNPLVRYQYILDGLEKVWSPITDKSFATFGNLFEGHYTFKVKARSPEGVWSEPLSYSFAVLPPLHRTWWAYSIYTMLFLSLIYSGLQFQKHRIVRAVNEKARQKQTLLDERLRISRDLHDEVGATLSGIVMYSHLAKAQAEQGLNELENSLNIVQETASEMVVKLNDVVWLINPLQDTIEKLLQRLEEYATLTASAKNMNVNISDSGPLADIILPVETRKNIYLICKEAINNAVKYSEGTMIELSVARMEDILEFTIKDNGIGFDPEKVNRGNGLDNMQQRADDINADFTIQQDPGSGMIVSLKCKITQLRYEQPS